MASCFNSVFYYSGKFVFGVVLSSLGILYSESLSAIPYLRSFSEYILSLVENHSNFKFLPSKDIFIKDEDLNPYAIFGVVVLGLTGLTISLLVSDYYFPDFIDKIPVINTYVDFINNSVNNFSSWVSSFFKSKPSLDTLLRSPSTASDIQLPSNIPSPMAPPYAHLENLENLNNNIPTPDSGINPW
uniref:Uncharacterized protein n=1 Tax=Ganoderma calidophilum TaxID=2026244 RepID=A0A2S1WBM8_9APHY|nr:hypothetical protein [Ganoderma calidophilum]AWJ63985.1 hypothetical protein [Ganoderma calidophilum]